MRCRFHIDARYAGHLTPRGHPERPERIERLVTIADALQEYGASPFASQRAATIDELVRVHTPEHVERMANTAQKPYVMIDADTHTSAESFALARLAAGALLDLVDGAMENRFECGLAAVRPPGHHAERDRAMGFCLFNNVAVAAAHLIEHHGLERVLVVDWDVHHGNGTQHCFETEGRVLFVSLHQFPFYPGTGDAGEVGEGAGRGRTVNIPMPAGCGDVDYLAAFDSIVLPVARAFDPQFVLVSAGFDAHERDPLGGMCVTASGFDTMTSMLLELAVRHCDGKLVGVLEGGYDLEALEECVRTMVRRLVIGAGELDAIPSAGVGEAAIQRAVEIQRAMGNLPGQTG